MSYTKGQVSNFLNDKILFRFSISKEFTIEYIDYEKFFTFEELERIIKSNYDYWNSINESSSTNFASSWKNLNDSFNAVKNYILESEELDIVHIHNQIYSILTPNWETTGQDKKVYIISVSSPIDKDTQFHKSEDLFPSTFNIPNTTLIELSKVLSISIITTMLLVAIFQTNITICFIRHCIYLEKIFQILKIM